MLFIIACSVRSENVEIKRGEKTTWVKLKAWIFVGVERLRTDLGTQMTEDLYSQSVGLMA